MRKVLKVVIYFFGGLLTVVIGIFIYVINVAKIDPPHPENVECLSWQRMKIDSGSFTLNANWLRKSESGLYEMYVEGKPFERGVAIGKLTKELAQYQEEVFVKQIRQLVSSEIKLNF